MCAGDGRDVLGVLGDHPRRADLRARLVELDPDLVARSRAMAERAGLRGVEVVQGDASVTSAYDGAVPAHIVMVCGVFGNITANDIQTTVSVLPSLAAPGATVIWTRHRRAPDLTPTIRSWFVAAGFAEVAFDTPEDAAFSVGTNRLIGPTLPSTPDRKMFSFVGDGRDAHL
jgi:hypothetical protein